MAKFYLTLAVLNFIKSLSAKPFVSFDSFKKQTSKNFEHEQQALTYIISMKSKAIDYADTCRNTGANHG